MAGLEVTFGPAQIDSFEDQDLSEYSGATGDFSITQDFATDGDWGLEYSAADGLSIISQSGLDHYPSQGDIIKYDWETTASTSATSGFARFNFGFGVQTNDSNRYYVQINVDGGSTSIWEDGADDRIAVDFSTDYDANTHYSVEITWDDGTLGGSAGDLTVVVTDEDAGTEVTTISANDTTYSDGGIEWEFANGSGETWNVDDARITNNIVVLPTNTSGTVTVREDVGDTGTVDNTNSASLVDGQTTYTLSGFDASTGNDIETEVELDTTDDTLTAEVTEPVSVTPATAVLTGSVAMVGGGELTAAARVVYTAAVPLVGGADLQAAGTNITTAASQLSGSADLAAAPTAVKTVTAALAGSGTLSITGTSVATPTATLTGSGDLSVTGTIDAPIVTASVDLTGGATVTTDSTRILFRGATLAGSATVSTIPTVVVVRAAGLEGSANLTAAGTGVTAPSAALVGGADVMVDVSRTISASAALTGGADLTAKGIIFVSLRRRTSFTTDNDRIDDFSVDNDRTDDMQTDETRRDDFDTQGAGETD